MGGGEGWVMTKKEEGEKKRSKQKRILGNWAIKLRVDALNTLTPADFVEFLLSSPRLSIYSRRAPRQRRTGGATKTEDAVGKPKELERKICILPRAANEINPRSGEKDTFSQQEQRRQRKSNNNRKKSGTAESPELAL